MHFYSGSPMHFLSGVDSWPVCVISKAYGDHPIVDPAGL
jgi:hypothetical protein